MENKHNFPLNIRQNVKNFLKEKLFLSLKNVAGQDREVNLFMMIVDEETSHVLNSFIQYTDLIDCGIAGLERLELTRKRLPNLHAIYFISGTMDSVERIAKEFENESKPQYGLVHIIFKDHISEEIVEYLMSKENLANRIVNIKEINLSFSCMDESSFTLDMNGVLRDLYSDTTTKEK